MAPDHRYGLSEAATQVFESLKRRGASFLADLVKDTRQLTSLVEDALWELAAAGLVTADGFENLRALIIEKGDLRALATIRAGRVSCPAAGHCCAPVRWSPPSSGLKTETLEAIARQLLLRWGVVFRDLLARETIAPPWRDLLVTFRRMEAQERFAAGDLCRVSSESSLRAPSRGASTRDSPRPHGRRRPRHIGCRSVEPRRHHHAWSPASARCRGCWCHCGKRRSQRNSATTRRCSGLTSTACKIAVSSQLPVARDEYRIGDWKLAD